MTIPTLVAAATKIRYPCTPAARVATAMTLAHTSWDDAAHDSPYKKSRGECVVLCCVFSPSFHFYFTNILNLFGVLLFWFIGGTRIYPGGNPHDVFLWASMLFFALGCMSDEGSLFFSFGISVVYLGTFFSFSVFLAGLGDSSIGDYIGKFSRGSRESHSIPSTIPILVILRGSKFGPKTRSCTMSQVGHVL